MKNSKIRIVISCSGKFHAFALAEQLERHGMLENLYTSYSSIKNPLAKHLVSRRDKELIPAKRIKTFLPIAFGIKLYKNPFFWNDLFDRWVARKIRKSDATVFIGWSGMSLNSIEAAKQKGMLTILERGSSHISFQFDILRTEYKTFGLTFIEDPKVMNKELQEYATTDLISIPSSYVKRTFQDFGVDPDKLCLNNYGAGGSFRKAKSNRSEVFTVLYLGRLSIQKGLIYLFEAMKTLIDKGYDIQCLFVGTVDEEFEETVSSFEDSRMLFLGQKDHYSLSEIISSSDIAVQPSLQEGLSMVIPQIMSCGVPIIASTNSGGEDLIQNGINGYIVPIRNSKAIAERIEFLYLNSDKLDEMKQNVLSNPLDLSWQAYGDRYIKNINNHIK